MESLSIAVAAAVEAAKNGDDTALLELIRAHNERVRNNNAVVAMANIVTPGLIPVIPDTPGEAQAYADALMAAQKRADDAQLKRAASIALGNRRSARIAQVIPFPARREGQCHPRERRDGSSSRTSSNDPGDPDPEPPAPDWRWATPPGWQGYVASIHAGAFEQDRRRRLIGGAR